MAQGDADLRRRGREGVDASDPARRAIGSPDSFRVESGERVLKAARYNALANFDQRVTDHLGWTVGAEFLRDRFSGLSGRTLGLAGVSYLLANRSR